MKQLCAAALTLGLLACSSGPSHQAPSVTSRSVPFHVSWINGTARLSQPLSGSTFGLALDLRVSDWPSASSALGSHSPCFNVALVERCSNGVTAQAVPTAFIPGMQVGTTPLWCPAIGTSFHWSAEFVDYRRVIGNPGSFFQPLMRCQGYADFAVHLFPSGLRADPTALPRPGVPVDGLRITEWQRL